MKVFARRQNSAEQDGGVDGRNFRHAHPLPRVDVDEVVEKAVHLFHMVQQELKGGDHPAADLVWR